MEKIDILLKIAPDFNFKKNDTVKFKLKRKILTGKIIKTGTRGVDVLCNGKYYYCSDYNYVNKIFQKCIPTKNYKTKF